MFNVKRYWCLPGFTRPPVHGLNINHPQLLDQEEELLDYVKNCLTDVRHSLQAQLHAVQLGHLLPSFKVK
jgi:hypothetical protein